MTFDPVLIIVCLLAIINIAALILFYYKIIYKNRLSEIQDTIDDINDKNEINKKPKLEPYTSPLSDMDKWWLKKQIPTSNWTTIVTTTYTKDGKVIDSEEEEITKEEFDEITKPINELSDNISNIAERVRDKIEQTRNNIEKRRKK